MGFDRRTRAGSTGPPRPTEPCCQARSRMAARNIYGSASTGRRVGVVRQSGRCFGEQRQQGTATITDQDGGRKLRGRAQDDPRTPTLDGPAGRVLPPVPKRRYADGLQGPGVKDRARGMYVSGRLLHAAQRSATQAARQQQKRQDPAVRRHLDKVFRIDGIPQTVIPVSAVLGPDRFVPGHSVSRVNGLEPYLQPGRTRSRRQTLLT